ncbi:alpha/beta hydrolase [Dactylosporangium sp. McL0621]|uniref:alpha/beta hydrolase n=1 Tax=Dactylosporangium sp. McL0621 TaxID=3415678 RepID=UPI003CEED2F3
MEVEFHSLDGLLLRGSLLEAAREPFGVVVLVHGGGANRDEGGFFVRLAQGLRDARLASLRFDIRGHGASEGRQENLTIAAVANDIRAAVEYAQHTTGNLPVSLIGTSFGGGICAFFAARHPGALRRLVLLNPLMNYKKRFVEDKPYWTEEHINPEAGRTLAAEGTLVHSPTFNLGRPLLNEVFYLRPEQELGAIDVPTLFVHGTKDTFVPIDSSRRYIRYIGAETRLVEVNGAQHGFAVDNDPSYADPQSIAWQTSVIKTAAEWLAQSPPIDLSAQAADEYLHRRTR